MSKLHFHHTDSHLVSDAIGLIEVLRHNRTQSIDLSRSHNVLYPVVFPMLQRRFANCSTMVKITAQNIGLHYKRVSEHVRKHREKYGTRGVEDMPCESDIEREFYLEITDKRLGVATDMTKKYTVDDFVMALLQVPNLEYLDLRRNRFSANTMHAIADYIRATPTLHTIGMDICDGEDDHITACRELLACIRDSSHIKSLLARFT